MKIKLLLVIWAIFHLCNILLFAQQPDEGTEEQQKAGQNLYELKCAQCHGISGDGQGIAASRFKPLPRDFTSAQIKIRTTANGELPLDSDLKKIIRNGMPYTGMPAWPDLSEDEVDNLVFYIKTFSEDYADPDYLPKALNLPQAPSFSLESALRGRVVFAANECIKCHGNYGRGDGPSAPTLTDDAGKHIMPVDMTKRWTFRGGGSRSDIYRTFTTGINGTPMPSYEGLISEEEQWQLVDYVYSLSDDEPNYAILIIANAVNNNLDIVGDSTLFDDVKESLFPIVGQIIEPGREFYPGVNAIKVKAVFNQDEIAIQLKWNDMSAQQTGLNAPNMEAPLYGEEEEVEDDLWGDDFADDDFGDEESTDSEEYADAVSIQFSTKTVEGSTKPYFLFGDSKNAMDIWFYNLADSAAELYEGRGSQNIVPVESVGLSAISIYQDGQWTVTFKQKREQEGKLTFSEGSFIPISFSVWDGFNKERGNKRGISSWYNLYLEPQEKESPFGSMFKWGFLIVFAELGLIFGIRKKYKKA